MSDTTWIRLAPGVVAEVEFDRYEYEMGGDEIPGKLTGVVRLTKAAVLDGLFGLDATEVNERPASSEEKTA
ncbi:hypothetical protein [Streptomyces naphthomycinicus]|uniref:hypothetical protein n=1 Tax=Streptomyces naphthomycinicus TaxID=2872625 RepID=UPI001CEDFF53|nr:hypothetical protein [Streptomyces sp. TML10]